MTKEKFNEGKIVIYQTSKKEVELRVRLEKETIWLDAHQMAHVFSIDRTVVVKHIRNIYKTGELPETSTCAKIAQVAADGKTRKMNLYNLDMIISVGYRVNSKRATQFRIWATKVLKTYLVQGYAINQKRLLETRQKFKELQTVITFLQKKSKKELLSGQTGEILNLLSSYAKTLTLLKEYDKGRLRAAKGKKGKFVLKYEECQRIVKELKKELIAKKEAADIFGRETSGAFEGIIKGLCQTFDRKELYPTIEDKASHLLYFTIKDHPFIDGNKRIGSFLFVYFLDKNNYLYRENGEKKINDNALTALALLIAESNPNEKDILIKIIINMLSDYYAL